MSTVDMPGNLELMQLFNDRVRIVLQHAEDNDEDAHEGEHVIYC